MSEDNLATLASTIKLGIENKLKEVHTAMPGIISAFDPETQLASVQPAIQRVFKTIDGDDEVIFSEDLPVLINVPIIFPRGGGYSITFPIVIGDECLLIFNERSIDSWHETGEVSTPSVRRFHALSDAVCYVGLSSKQNKVPNYRNDVMQIKSDNGETVVSLGNDGSLHIYSSIITIIDSPSTIVTGDLQVNGNISSDGAVSNSGADIGSTHFHEQGNDSAGDSQVPTETP